MGQRHGHREVPSGPLADIARQLAKGAPATSEASKSGPAGVKFKPSGKRLILDNLVNSLGQTDEQKNRLRQVLTQGMEAMEGVLAKEGRSNDVAAAYALFINTQWSAATGKTVPDAASDALVRQVDSLFNTPQIRAASDTDKQKFYEYCAYLSVFTSFVQANAKDASMVKNSRAAAAQLFQSLLGVAPSSMTITSRGLGSSGTATAAPKSSGGGNTPVSAAGITVRASANWQKESDGSGTLFTRSTPTEYGGLKVTALVLTGGAKPGTPEALAYPLFESLVRNQIPAPGLPKELRPEVYRRYVGNGLRCSFIVVSRKIKRDSMDYLGTTQEIHLYAVETAGKVVPIMVTLTGHEGSGPDGKLVKSGVRDEWVEELLAGLSGTAASKPLFTGAELAGAYKMSASALGPQFYNIYTGASAGYGFIQRGSQINLTAGGTFDQVYYSSSGIGAASQFYTEKTKGSYKILKNGTSSLLVLTDAASGKVQNYRLAGAFTLPGEGGKVMITLPMNTPATAGDIAKTADRYLTKEPKK